MFPFSPPAAPAADIVTLDRADVRVLDDQARRLLLALRQIERLTHDAPDDRSRAVYAEIRAALGSARWVAGAMAEALA